MIEAYDNNEEAKETARELNDAINKTRATANQLVGQYNCSYAEAFNVAKGQEGIENFSDIVNSRQKANANVKVYQLKQDTRYVA